MKGMWKKSAVVTALCMALLCVSAHGEGATQEQKKVFNDAVGMMDKFLQRGRYIKIYSEEDMDCIYMLATIILGVEIENDGFSIAWGDDSQEFPFDECSLSLDSECNLIIKPKK